MAGLPRSRHPLGSHVVLLLQLLCGAALRLCRNACHIPKLFLRVLLTLHAGVAGSMRGAGTRVATGRRIGIGRLTAIQVEGAEAAATTTGASLASLPCMLAPTLSCPTSMSGSARGAQRTWRSTQPAPRQGRWGGAQQHNPALNSQQYLAPTHSPTTSRHDTQSTSPPSVSQSVHQSISCQSAAPAHPHR